MSDTPHDPFPEDERVLTARRLPDGRWHCAPPYVDPETFEVSEVVTLTDDELIAAGYETHGTP